MAVWAMIMLHTPTGKEIYVNGSEVMIIRDADPKISSPQCLSDVLVHDTWVCVRENPWEVKRLVDEARL